MQLVGKIVSAILALLAIPMFTIAACNLAIEAAVFNRDTYDAVLEDDVMCLGMTITSKTPQVDSCLECTTCNKDPRVRE